MGENLHREEPVLFATCCERANLWARPETGHRGRHFTDTPPDAPEASYSHFSRLVGNFPTCGDTSSRQRNFLPFWWEHCAAINLAPKILGFRHLWRKPMIARNCADRYAQIWAKVLSRYGNRFFSTAQKWAADYPKLDCHRKFVAWQYNIFTQGAVGALCQPPDAMRKGAGAYGYILRIIPVCNYALRCDYSCHSFYTQKIAPSLW